jgi:hypothetical protein
MQIKILQEYAKDIKRRMYAVANDGGFQREHVRRAVSNLITAVVENPKSPPRPPFVRLAYPDDLACQMTGRPVGWLVVSGH